MSMGVKYAAQQCHHAFTPDSFTGGQLSSAEMPKSCRPQQFWSHTKVAVMSIPKRSKGRIQHPDAGYVNQMSILPEQFTGGQSCRTEMSSCPRPRQFLGQRKNAEMSFHTYPRGANHHTQKCYVRCAPDIFIWAERNSKKFHANNAPREGSL